MKIWRKLPYNVKCVLAESPALEALEPDVLEISASYSNCIKRQTSH